MNDQYRPEPDDTNPLSQGEGRDWSSQHPTPAEPTRQLPPMPESSSASTSGHSGPHAAGPAAPAPARRVRGLSAAVLAGALVLGGAAGVGGAAWYDAWQGDEPAAVSSTSTTDGSPVTASNAAAAPSGSVVAVANEVLPSVVRIDVSGQNGAGSGSGIVLDDKGNILTNNHVVALAGSNGSVRVSFNDGSTEPAKVVGTDPVTDLAVIKVSGVDNLHPATMGKSSALQVGQPVVAVGSPYGLNATVTSGIVSALHRPVSVTQETPSQPENPFGFGFPQQEQQQQQQSLSTTYPAIQTDAAINPGNSGGPLVDMAGQVVGINSSIRTANGGQSGSIGLGFAIPIDEALPIINQLVQGDTPTHARMAVTVSVPTNTSCAPDVDRSAVARGALVCSVQQGGAADDAGLQVGDLITKVDGEVIPDSESLVATVRGHRPGDEVQVTVRRGDATKTLTIKLGSDATTRSS